MMEYRANAPAAWELAHPGTLPREGARPALRLTVTEAAAKFGVSRQTLHAILSERASVTPEMAARPGKLRGNGGGLWRRMRQARDLWRSGRDLAKELAKIPTLRPRAA